MKFKDRLIWLENRNKLLWIDVKDLKLKEESLLSTTDHNRIQISSWKNYENWFSMEEII